MAYNIYSIICLVFNFFSMLFFERQRLLVSFFYFLFYFLRDRLVTNLALEIMLMFIDPLFSYRWFQILSKRRQQLTTDNIHLLTRMKWSWILHLPHLSAACTGSTILTISWVPYPKTLSTEYHIILLQILY